MSARPFVSHEAWGPGTPGPSQRHASGGLTPFSTTAVSSSPGIAAGMAGPSSSVLPDDPYVAYYHSQMAPYPPLASAGGGGGSGGGIGGGHPGLASSTAMAGPGDQHHHHGQLHTIDADGPYPPSLLPSTREAALPSLARVANSHGAYSAGLGEQQPPTTPSLGAHPHPSSAASSTSLAAMNIAPLIASPSAGSSGTQASPHMPKARSAMACQLCRRQKMKCEGPEKAPCRRCRAAQVECVFEAPPAAPPRPRGGGVTEAWVEGRLGQVEHRLDLLEDTAFESHALVPGSNGSASVNVSPQTVSDHERRINALEAQLYNLQIAMARQVQIPPHPQPPAQPQPSIYGSGPSNHSSIEYHASSAPSAQQAHPSYGGGASIGGNTYASSYSHPSLASSAPASQARYDSPTLLKHEPDRSSSAASLRTGPTANSDSHREKRHKGDHEPRKGDFVARGLVSEEEAALCFESYHLTFSSNGLEHPADLLHLSFEETRRRSPIFLATVISIGARALSRFDTFHTTYREAVRLAHESFIPSATAEDCPEQSSPRPVRDSVLPAFARPDVNRLDDSSATRILEFRLPTLTLKALVLLGLYHSMPELLVHAWMAGYRLIQPKATQAFYEMTPEERSSPKARLAVNNTRVGLVAWLWLSYYTYCRGQHGAVWLSCDLLRKRLELLSLSGFVEHETDDVIRTNFEGVAIMHNMFEQIGPGMRGSRPTRERVFETVRNSLAQYDEWVSSNSQMMETITQWGDSADLKSIVPLHYFRLFVLRYVFQDVPDDQLDLADPQVETWARMAAESAIVLLRWGVESRIWMPFSVVGNYVHNVNVPAALWTLGRLARLYPALIDFHTVRPILHRLAKQCTVTISSPGATYREILRARKTKHEVEQLDRVAFELCEADAFGPEAVTAEGRTSRMGGGGAAGGGGGGSGHDPTGLTGSAGGSVHGGGAQGSSAGSSAAGDASADAPGLFGHEVTASLNSLRLELNLWAKPLRGFEEDD